MLNELPCTLCRNCLEEGAERASSASLSSWSYSPKVPASAPASFPMKWSNLLSSSASFASGFFSSLGGAAGAAAGAPGAPCRSTSIH